MKKNKGLKILGFGALLVTAAVLVNFQALRSFRFSTPAAEATSQNPTASITFDAQNGGHITLSSGGPFTEDIQATICVTSSNSPSKVCATTPWASASQAVGGWEWSSWVWPGYNNGIYPGPNSTGFVPEHVNLAAGIGVVSVSLNTKPLPAGDSLNNVRLGFGIAEDNAGPLDLQGMYGNPVATPATVPCDYGYTPVGGGISTPAAYGHPYTDCSNSVYYSGYDPDDVQVGISATVQQGYDAIEAATTIPNTFNPSETKTMGIGGATLSITMKNTGFQWTPTFTAKDVNGTQSGTCNYDYNKDGVNDAPMSAGKCSVTTVLTSSNYFFVHQSSQFSVNPERIPITYSGVTKTTVYNPAETLPPPGSASFCAAYGSNPKYHVLCQSTVIPASWSISYSGGGYSASIANGQSFVFPINSLTAPAAPGTYNETWQMASGTTLFGTPFVLPITVGGAGTINVISANSAFSAQTSGSVPASWSLFGPGNPCGANQCPTSTGSQYHKQAFGLYTIANIEAADPTLYSLRGVEQTPSVAKVDSGPLDHLFALSKGMLFGVAKAYYPYGCFGSNPSACTSSSSFMNVQSLLLSNDPNNILNQANFVVLWDPIPAMGVAASPSPLAFDPSGTTSGIITVQNTGAPGSTLTWTASTTYTGGGATGWLTPETTGGTLTNDGGQTGSSGNTSAVTFALSPSASGMATGTYTADISFVGTSPTGPCVHHNNNCGVQDVIITLNIGGGNNDNCSGPTCDNTSTSTQPTQTPTSTPTSTQSEYQPSCALSANPTAILIPGSTTLTYSCKNVSSCTLSGGGFGSSSIVSVNGDSTAKGTTTDAPSANTFYTISCYGTGSYSAVTSSATTEVTVTNPGRTETNP
jgi:hypothetical protein